MHPQIRGPTRHLTRKEKRVREGIEVPEYPLGSPSLTWEPPVQKVKVSQWESSCNLGNYKSQDKQHVLLE